MTFFNEIDPFAAQWVRELMHEGLVPAGEVDERSIKDVAATDLRRFGRCHFFAGIAGWELALQLAGWPADRPVWTGSCPCQPYSSAGKGKGDADPRNLWPDFFRLIRECRPECVFGEQVASSNVVGTELEASFVAAVQRGDYGRANKLAERIAKRHDGEALEELAPRWVDRVRSDVEAEGYAFRFKVLGAHSAGADHIRQRLFWVAHRDNERRGAGRASEAGERGADVPERLLPVGSVADVGGQRIRTDGRGANAGAASGTTGKRDKRKRVRFDFGDGKPLSAESINKLHEQGRLDDLYFRAQEAIDNMRRRMADGESSGRGQQTADDREPSDVEHTAGERPGSAAEVDAQEASGWGTAESRDAGGDAAGVAQGDAGSTGPQERGSDGGVQREARRAPAGQAAELSGDAGFWSDSVFVPCRDGKLRRVPTQLGLFPLAHGVPGRVGILRGAGNAIVPQVAAEFVRAFLEAEAEGGVA